MSNSLHKSIATCIVLAIVFSVVSIDEADAQHMLVPYDATTDVTSTATFFASPPIAGPANPGPYGIANNTDDTGWIWEPGSFLDIDFGTAEAITRVRPYSTFNAGSRGATFTVEHSDDGAFFLNTDGGSFPFVTNAGVGVNDAGDPELAGGGFAGWYALDFNPSQNPHQYWRVRHDGNLVSHAPRLGEMEFFEGIIIPDPPDPRVVPYDAPTQASGSDPADPATFFATSPATSAFSNPGPYGFANSGPDAGWIWPRNEDQNFSVDFGSGETRPITGVRLWSGFSGGGRGTELLIEHSDDGVIFSSADGGTIDYHTMDGAGVDLDGNPVPSGSYGGWYEYSFNPAQSDHQFWRITNGPVTDNHMPRTGEIQFLTIPEPSSLAITAIGLAGLIGLGRKGRKRR